jgi:hypothetical protein
VDALVGGLAEDHVSSPSTASVGPLFHKILGEQFARMRDGDRFWYGQSDEKYGLGAEAAKLLEGITTQGGMSIGASDIVLAAKLSVLRTPIHLFQVSSCATSTCTPTCTVTVRTILKREERTRASGLVPC